MNEPKYKIGDKVMINFNAYGSKGEILKYYNHKNNIHYLVNPEGNLIIHEMDISFHETFDEEE